ncbi:MAG TPA: FliA/WhiG family RNA polymerase sigma factor [Ktedonobacteraceae bacterium]|jgi:RNA polymerase sigma factor for flagellar operon FliA|nr:FliA/WhiG family RNA polymerase sigma factor [Ktedonobacteraceae bacterium]
MSVSAIIDELWADFVATRRPELREELITAYAPLVRYVVGRLGIPSTSLLEADDLLSYGMIGLINAIDRYDPTRGIRFEAFATSRIRGAVIDQLRTLNWLPRSAVARVRQIEQVLAQLEQRYGRPATEVEAAQALNVSLDRYRQMLLEAGAMILSLDAPLGTVTQQENEGALSLGDLIEDHSTPDPVEQAEKHEMLQLLSTTIDQLPARERLLLSLYYQEELTMKEISKIMGVSESRVCQLHMQAILRLRSAFHLRQEKARSKKVQHAHVIDK